jgi:hypothetical protein
LHLLLCKNGCENWVWMCDNACSTSEGEDTEEECPGCKHTKRTGDFTSRNGGWSKVGMRSHNDLHKRVKEDSTGDGKLRHSRFLGGAGASYAYKTLCVPCHAFWQAQCTNSDHASHFRPKSWQQQD